MEKAAGQQLLAELMDAATAPGLSDVHTWRNGDVASGTIVRPCIVVGPGRALSRPDARRVAPGSAQSLRP